MSNIECVKITNLLPFIHRLPQKPPSEGNNRLDSRRMLLLAPVMFGLVIWLVTRGKAA